MRRVWVIGLAVLVACVFWGFVWWKSAASDERRDALIRVSIAAQLNRTFGTGAYAADDIQLKGVYELDPHLRSFHITHGGTAIVPRKAFAARGKGLRRPIFSPDREAWFGFKCGIIRRNESLAMAPHLGAIRPTWRMVGLQSLRESDPYGLPLDANRAFAEIWPELEKATANDLFDLRVMLPFAIWNFALFPDSHVAVDARILRGEGRLHEAADLLCVSLSHDAYKAPLVRTEVGKIQALLSPNDPRRAILESKLKIP